MSDESPVIEETPEEKPKTEQVDVDSLLQTLDQFEVDSPEKLQGKLQNANDFAHMQSERDRLANELNEIRTEISGLKRQPAQPIDEYQEGQPVDIESLVAKSATKAVSDALDARDRRALENQKRMNDTWLKITNHKRYPLVKDEFEEALKDPATVMKLQTGQVDAIEFFNDMVIEKVVGVARQASTVVKQMKGSGDIAPPHIEGNLTVPQSNQEELTAKQKKLNELQQKAARPGGLHDDEEDDLINAALGDFLR
jgi:hypothetical protein